MLDWIWTNKEWLFSGIGVLVATTLFGILYTWLRKSGSSFVSVASRGRGKHDRRNSQLVGRWYGYYPCWVNEATEVVSEVWEVKEQDRSQLAVTVSTLGGRALSFRGNISFERDQFLVRLIANEHQEEVQCRFKMPIPGNDDVVVGLFLGFDFNGTIMVGTHLLSRRPLDAESVNQAFADRFTFASSRRAIRIAK